jgi:hypothetical protein
MDHAKRVCAKGFQTGRVFLASRLDKQMVADS